MNQSLFNYEPELALLGTIISSPSLVYNVVNIRSFMFSSLIHKEIYETIEVLVKDGLVPDIHLIENHLASTGKLERVGGREFLTNLLTYAKDEANIKEYEREIVNGYKARTFIDLSAKVPSAITDLSSIDTLLNQFKSKLDNLMQANGGETTAMIADLVDESYAEILSRVDSPGIRGKSTGFQNIDLVTTGFNAGDLWIIAGRPGAGKSALLCNTILRGAKDGVKSLVFELEMTKQQLIERMLSIETGIDMMNLRMGTLKKVDLEKIKNTIEVFKTLPIYVDTNFWASEMYVESTIRRYKKLHDINVSYLDNINIFVERSDNARHDLGRISRTQKLLANELGITNVLFAQLNRGVESRDDKRPKLSDLRESGNLEEDADIVIGLYREEYYDKNTPKKGELESIILKHRQGPCGMIPLKFDAATMHIGE